MRAEIKHVSGEFLLEIRVKWLHEGVMVDYHSVIGEPATQHNMRVRTDPQLMASGHWVVWLDGKAGCVHVDAVTPAGAGEGA